MLQKMSDQHKISFLDGVKTPETLDKIDVKPEKTIQQIAEAQKAKKLDNKDNGLMTTHTISSARTGVIQDTGGPTKYVRSESSNTLWDSDRTAKLSKDIDSKTKTIQDKAVIADNKRHAEEKRMNGLVETLRNTDQTKASAISPTGSLTSGRSRYKVPTNNMSIFDTKDFERLQEKTAGEKVVEDNASRKDQKDESWRGGGKSVKSSEVVSNFFDQLLNKKDQ